jgi:hypothetical protein
LERFVMITAITLALLWAAFYFMGPHFVTFADDDRPGRGHVAEALRPAQAGHLSQSFAVQEISIEHAAAHVAITTEDRTDIAVEITNPGRTPMPEIHMEGATLSIDGHMRGRVSDCQDDGGVKLDGYGNLQLADLPQIVIHAPRTLKFSASGAVTSDVGAAQSVEATLSGCGNAQIADVAGPMRLKMLGIGHARAGAAQGVDIELAGASGVVLGAVTDHANIQTAGTGDVSIASLTGPLESQDGGVGNLTIQGGQISTAHVVIAGVGNARIAAPIQSLHAEVMGVGTVNVSAQVGDLSAEVMGPGSVHVQAVSGQVRKEVMGPGSVTIGS